MKKGVSKWVETVEPEMREKLGNLTPGVQSDSK